MEECTASGRNQHSFLFTLRRCIAYLSPPYPGAISDNELHNLERIGQRLGELNPPDSPFRVAYVYDKGLTDVDLFITHSVDLITPTKRLNKQTAVKVQVVNLNIAIAKSRILVSLVFVASCYCTSL